MILPRSGNKLIWKVAGRQAFIELPVVNVHSKMGTVCHQDMGSGTVRSCGTGWCDPEGPWVTASSSRPLLLGNLPLPGAVLTAAPFV